MPPAQIDRFELLRQLAASSSGEVYKAIDPATSRQVAIRTIRSTPGQSASVAFRFLRVALQRAIELDSPNIAVLPVLDRPIPVPHDCRKKP